MKTTIFVAVMPWDYTTAHVELFETREDAQQFIQEMGGSNAHYGSILEREVLSQITAERKAKR